MSVDSARKSSWRGDGISRQRGLVSVRLKWRKAGCAVRRTGAWREGSGEGLPLWIGHASCEFRRGAMGFQLLDRFARCTDAVLRALRLLAGQGRERESVPGADG